MHVFGVFAVWLFFKLIRKYVSLHLSFWSHNFPDDRFRNLYILLISADPHLGVMVAAPQVGVALSPSNVVFVRCLKLDDWLVVTIFILKH